jgi:hypothetical protein
MAIVDINHLPKPVAVALDWHLLPGTTSERKEINALAKRTGSKFGCVLSDDEAGLTIVGLSSDNKESVNCGAAWLARASAGEPLILIEPLEDGRLWLCAARAGLPVQGLDIVIESSLLHERLTEFLRESPDAKLCTTLENLDTVYANVVPQSFAELVANTKSERVKRIAGINPAIALTAGVLVVVFGGWYGVDAYLTQMRQKDARAKLQQMSVEQQRRDAEAVEARKRARVEAGVAMVRSVILDKPSVPSLMAGYFEVMEAQPLTAAGWKLVGYDCGQLSCSLMWLRDKGGTIAGFLAEAEAHGWATASAEGNDAVTVHQVKAEPRKEDIEALAEDAAFRAALETRLQQAAAATGLRYDLSKSSPLEKLMTGAPDGAPADPTAGQPALPWKVGTLTIKGTALYELRDLPDYITHAGLSIKNVRGDLKTNEWTMELNYATR